VPAGRVRIASVSTSALCLVILVLVSFNKRVWTQVLQHNPPPIIRFIIQQFIQALNPKGVALFQVPTYRLGYEFSQQKYLSREAKRREMEMHLLPQHQVFEAIGQEGGRLLEVIEDALTGSRYKEMSNTFLVQKE